MIWLFDSRADDGKKEGDYDFLIETSLDQPDTIVERKIALIAELRSSPAFEDGKNRYDCAAATCPFEMPIYAVAWKERVRL